MKWIFFGLQNIKLDMHNNNPLSDRSGMCVTMPEKILKAQAGYMKKLSKCLQFTLSLQCHHLPTKASFGVHRYQSPEKEKAEARFIDRILHSMFVPPTNGQVQH